MPPSSRMLSLKECYDILGIDKSAGLQELKRAYRRRAFELHPDLNPDNPDSSRQFQLLNEAYVALSAILKDSEKTEPGADATAQAEGHAGAAKDGNSGQKDHEFSDTQRREAHKAYAQQDVLRDLLNDPFARRVFEDIYSELNRQQESEGHDAEQKKDNQGRPDKGEARAEKEKNSSTAAKSTRRIINLPDQDSGFGNGVGGAVKGWLRKQIDDEQSLTLPAAGLRPGRRVRLQIRRGLSDELETVEVTLPPNFAIGKPLRLKGLGKKVGPWVGDLYLTLTSKE